MIKKFFSFFCCTVILLLSCSIGFFSFAVDTVSLPFPNPSDVVGDVGAAFTYTYRNSGSTTNRYVMAVVYCSDPDAIIQFSTNSSYQVTIFIQTTKSAIYTISSFTYSDNGSTYSYKSKTAGNLGQSNNYTLQSYVFATHKNASLYSYEVYNTSKPSLDTFSTNSIHQTYSYSGVVTDVMINDVIFAINENSNKINLTNSKLTTISDYLNSINNTIPNIDQNLFNVYQTCGRIEIYTQEISSKLDKLLELQGYSDPSPTTTNSVANDYESAENALGDSAFNTLDNFEVPDFSSNSSSLGSGFLNAVQFLSSNMEFLSGNKSSSYNTTSDNTLDDTMSKMSTLIFVVLTIGLVSFVLNLVSSKGDN